MKKGLVEKAIAIIEEEFALISGVGELAEMLGVSDCHLIRCFKASTGLSPGQYLISTRIRIARLLLSHRNYSVETIAQMIGYSGANYFCKVFRRAAGISPQAYRESQLPAPNLSEEDRMLLEELDRLSHT